MRRPGVMWRAMLTGFCMTLLISTALQDEGLAGSVGKALAVAIGVAAGLQILRAISRDRDHER